MTDKQTPPDWVLIEAAKRSGVTFSKADLRHLYRSDNVFRALCDMIERYEQPPPDRKLLCAREAVRREAITGSPSIEQAAFRAIELWTEGYGE